MKALNSGFDLPAIAAPTSEAPARLIVAPPLPDAPARGLVVLPYRAENLRIVDVFGTAGLSFVPRIGHIHVSVDGAQWHWVDARPTDHRTRLVARRAYRTHRSRRSDAPRHRHDHDRLRHPLRH